MDLITEMTELGLAFITKYYYDDYYYSYIFEYQEETCVIIDENLCDSRSKIFHYEKFCEMQNEYSNKYSVLLRFLLTPDLTTVVTEWIRKDITSIQIKKTAGTRENNIADNSVLESRFEEIFEDAYGSDSLNYLNKEYGVSINNKSNAFIDYVIQTKTKSFAIEENGVNYHHPVIIGQKKYINQLVRQNTLSLLGNNVFRFSTNNIMAKEQMIDNIRRFFGPKENLVTINSIKNERKFELFEHQINYLEEFDRMRENGVRTSLVVLPTASGKSQIVVSDLEGNYSKFKTVLIMVPSVAIKNDWIKRTEGLKAEVVDILTYNAAYINKFNHSPTYYDYIVFDEAHHAQAPNCKRTLQYYNPAFLVGLTATPDRTDQKQLCEIFGTYDTHLTLEEAIEKDIISNIRVFRLKSNIDLSEVRFNGKDYNNSDIEKILFVDSRNELIAKTLKKYFNPTPTSFKQGLIFCVNVEHSKKMAKIMNDFGFSCKALYGSDPKSAMIFNEYQNKKLQFITTCQMISEGWDSPQTEIVVMARPTLSKVLYQQQLGRGARKYQNKECLYCIDVVDNYNAQLKPWSFNSLFHFDTYTPWMGVKAERFSEYLELFGLYEEEVKLEEIDILTLEEKYPDRISIEQAARELYIDTKTLGNWVKKEASLASLYLPVGNRQVPYFTDQDITKIRIAKKLKVHNDETIFTDFIEFINTNSFTYSFKIVFMLSFIELVDQEGECSLSDLLKKYRNFYLDRLKRNIPVDRAGNVYTEDYLNNESKMKNSILSNPFEKFERKRFVYYAKTKDFNLLSFNPVLWEQIKGPTLTEIKTTLENTLEDYYKELQGL